MKEVELKKSTSMYKWYKFFWCKEDYEMPLDTCTYYRNAILSFPLILISFIGLILDKLWKGVCDSFGNRVAMTLTIILVPLLFGCVGKNDAEIENSALILLWLWGWVILAICVAIIALICLCVHAVHVIKDRREDKKALLNPRSVKRREPSVFYAWYKQVKDKTCSKINWV